MKEIRRDIYFRHGVRIEEIRYALEPSLVRYALTCGDTGLAVVLSIWETSMRFANIDFHLNRPWGLITDEASVYRPKHEGCEFLDGQTCYMDGRTVAVPAGTDIVKTLLEEFDYFKQAYL
jgi:hypothetical protein